MAQTNIPQGSVLARKEYSVALVSQSLRAPTNRRRLMGPAPQMSDLKKTMKVQSDPGMPFVEVTDLTKAAGDTVSVDAFNVTTGKPIMGDRNAEGLAVPLSPMSMDVKINNSTWGVDAGGKMSQKRTKHDLRMVAMAHHASYWPSLLWQRSLVHAAGLRGVQGGQSWKVPLATDPDFSEIMVNPLKAPTYNRHYVASGTTLVRGGAQLASMVTTDKFKLSHLDEIAWRLKSADTKIQQVTIKDDPAAYDSPILGILMLGPGAYKSLLTDLTANNNIRAFQQAAWNRASYGSKHPLFMGEVGMWNGVLVREMDFSILMNPGDTPAIVKVANRLTGTETTDIAVNTLDASTQVERSILLGAQGMAVCYGNTASDDVGAMYEYWYNLQRNCSVFAEFMGGESKLRYSFINENGDPEPTDNGIIAIDSAVPIAT
jgi:hypothetical protein